jgi:phosphoglycerate dehydrogenase-like enzyme
MSERIRIRNVYPFSDADKAMLAAIDPRLEWVHGGEDSAAWLDALDDPEVQIVSGSETPSSLERLPRLRWVSSSSAGVDYLVEKDPWGLGLEVTNGSGLHAVHMAEFVLAGVLYASERVGPRLANQVARGWVERRGLAGRRLRGRRAVIVGYGSIGRETARLLQAFGVSITAIKNDPTRRADGGWREPGTGDPDGTIPDRWLGPDALADAVRDADHVVLTAPATPRTTGIVSREALAAMRPDAWLHNVGRGALVDQPALVEALNAERIGGAWLDVTTPEPLPPDDPLWTACNAVVAPHVSGMGDLEVLWHHTALLLAEQLRRDLAGLPKLNVTSGAAGY